MHLPEASLLEQKYRQRNEYELSVLEYGTSKGWYTHFGDQTELHCWSCPARPRLWMAWRRPSGTQLQTAISTWFSKQNSNKHTIDIDKTCAMTNQPFRCGEKVIEANTKSNLLDDLVCIFWVEVIMNSLWCLFVEIFWRDLDEISDLCL